MDHFVHIVAGEQGAGSVAGALRLAGREEPVIGLRDPLNVGPLWDLETNGVARVAFWTEVLGADASSEIRADQLRDQASWTAIRSAEVVTTWYGRHPMEYLVACRVAAFCSRALEMREVLRPRRFRPELPEFYDAINLASPQELVGLPHTILRPSDIAARRAIWRRLTTSRNAMFRELHDERVVELTANGYDDLILAACTGWTRTDHVIASVLAHAPIGDVILTWRIRELVCTNALQARGEGRYFFAEIRRT